MKFYLETYGCQMNVADSELVANILVQSGYEQAANLNEADIILFNTCSVRQHAEERVIGRLTGELGRKQQKPELLLGVIGCMAQRLGKDLLKLVPGIDFTCGTDQYQKLPWLIEQTKNNISLAEVNQDNSQIYEGDFPKRSTRLNAFVTIMRGCNNFCSYCIVPYTRGRERSRAEEEIVAEVEQAGKNGYAEVTLLGQNVNSYQWQNTDFPGLLKRVNEIESIRRIRFVTSHPKDLSDALIAAMASLSKVCEHIHLPMQAGNNRTLQRMNRKYTIEHYFDLVEKLRKAIPGIAITTDIIAGFPGETDAEFEDTFNAMQAIRFDFAYMFKYSPRSGTAAAELTEQVEEDIRLHRLNRLIDLQSSITLEKYREHIGLTKEIYVEKISRRSEKEMAGKSRDFKITVFEGEPSLIGKFVQVKVTDASGWTLRGELL